MKLPAFVIHDHANLKRHQYVDELGRRISDLTVVQAIVRSNPVEGCSFSHRYIIEMAKNARLPAVWILEDDCQLTWDFDERAWIKTVFDALHSNFDVVVGGSANGQSPAKSGLADLVEVQRWSSCHCWVVSSKIYDDILALNPVLDIDVSASTLKCRKAVRVPFVARQIPSYSALQKRDVDYKQWFDAAEEHLKPFLEN